MSTAPLDTTNVQGDILSGLPKKTQTYVFFTINNDVTAFRTQLAKLIPLITSTAQVVQDRATIAENKKTAAAHGSKPALLTLAGVNIAFSQAALTKLGITDNIGDTAFVAGQKSDAVPNLGDPAAPNAPQQPNWLPEFLGTIHGVILVSGDCHATVNKTLAKVEQILLVGSASPTITEITRLVGDVRPGDQKGHEHFGFLDGISNPAVKDFDTKPNPGQETVRQGIMLLGRDGDANAPTRPSWALDGSFLVFRYLFQLVPEFNELLKANALPGQTPDEGAEFFGARLVGRWKSGAPVDLAPLQDDPKLGADPLRNNNFRFDRTDGGINDQNDQTRCPFGAHVRKTNPRADFENQNPPLSTEARRMIRRGIQFGPELTHAEITQKKTLKDRGLLFVCYQSSITSGFRFVQQSWANNNGFPFGNGKPADIGIDPIIGQGAVRTMSGTNPNNQSADVSLGPEPVVPKGGEYFFSPSISALKSAFALPSHN